MSDLKPADIEEIMGFIAKKTKKGKGYVWNFSDQTFKDFVEGCTGCDIDSKKYQSNEEGNSKAKRLRRFIRDENNDKVTLLLEEIVDYGKRKNLLLKTHIPKLQKIIRELKKYENTITISKDTVKNKKEEEILLKEIKEKISRGQYEFVIDRLHTLFRYKFEAIFKEIRCEIKGETLDSIAGQLNNILRKDEIFKESTTFRILSATQKIMNSFDNARNNKTYAHANTIMEKNEAEFLCNYMVYYYNFINRIEYKKIKIKAGQ